MAKDPHDYATLDLFGHSLPRSLDPRVKAAKAEQAALERRRRRHRRMEVSETTTTSDGIPELDDEVPF
jgi:hypothetical protein